MKKLLILLLLCVGFNSYAQQNKIIFFSPFYQESNISYKKIPFLITITNDEIIIQDAVNKFILQKYTIIKVKNSKLSIGDRMDYLTVNSNLNYTRIYLFFNEEENEIYLAIQEAGIVFRELKQIKLFNMFWWWNW